MSTLISNNTRSKGKKEKEKKGEARCTVCKMCAVMLLSNYSLSKKTETLDLAGSHKSECSVTRILYHVTSSGVSFHSDNEWQWRSIKVAMRKTETVK